MNNTNNAFCRLCAELKPHNMQTNLQIDKEMCEKVVNKLSRFDIVMDFKENILPKTVCLICIKSLEKAFIFVTAVEQAQAFLSDFNLVKIKRVDDNLDDNNIFYEPPAETKDFIDIKIENTQDPMDVDNEDDNVSEGCNNEDACNDYEDDSSVNISNVEIKPFVHFQTVNSDLPVIDVSKECSMENKQAIYESSDVVIEDKINIKDENDEYTSLNSIKNVEVNAKVGKSVNHSNNNKKTYILVRKVDVNTKERNIKKPTEVNHEVVKDNFKKETKQRQILTKPLENTVYSADYINKQINRRATVPIKYINQTWMDYVWKCSHCETLFSTLEELQKHSMEYHNSCNPYQCTECNRKKLRLNSFLRHVRTHKKYLQYSCYKCFQKFSRISETGQHKIKVHEKSDFICLGCNTTFSNDSELDEHVKNFYKNQWQKKLPVKLSNDKFTCSICKKDYASISGLRYHLQIHSDRKREHTCDICGKCFFTKISLKDHMVLHENKRLHQCEICKFSFKNIYQLRYHASVHSGIKPFTCDNCGKCFRNKRYLINHMGTHTDSFPYSCTDCNKKFRLKTHLKNHMLQHTGVKPFACEICSRDFTNLSNRNKHMRRRHGIEMAKKRQAAGACTVVSATGEVEFPEVDKINECKKIMMEQRNAVRPRNKKIGKVKGINKERKMIDEH